MNTLASRKVWCIGQKEATIDSREHSKTLETCRVNVLPDIFDVLCAAQQV